MCPAPAPRLLLDMLWSRQILVAITESPNSLSGSVISYGITLLRKIISAIVLERNIYLYDRIVLCRKPVKSTTKSDRLKMVEVS
jgi:hypothetical protein